MLFLQLKQAECALNDGRLDEAFNLIIKNELRSHKKGQVLSNRLAHEFATRAEKHFTAERLDLALTDCDKAKQLAGNKTKIEELRKKIVTELSADKAKLRRYRHLVQAVTKDMRQGRLSRAENRLGSISNFTQTMVDLADDVERMRDDEQNYDKKIQDAVNKKNFDSALDYLIQINKNKSPANVVSKWRPQIVEAVLKDVQHNFQQGRLDRSQLLIQRISCVDRNNLNVADWLRTLSYCKKAVDAADNGKADTACSMLKKAAQTAPSSKWLNNAVQAAEQWAKSQKELIDGPLGLMQSLPSSGCRPRASGLTPTRDIAMTPTEYIPPEGNKLPDPFGLNVDGGGSFVVVQKPRVTIGPISSSKQPDIGLMAPADLPVFTIERDDDDYFLISNGQTAVNGKPTKRRLLKDGDKIDIGPRCRMKFRLPNPACPTGVLELSGARLPRADTRKILLLNQALIIGPGNTPHIRINDLEAPVILQIRKGTLTARKGTSGSSAKADRKSAAQPIPMDETMEIGDVSLLIKKWK